MVLEASRNLIGTGQEPQSRDCPHLLEALGGEKRSQGLGRRTTPQPMETDLEIKTSGSESLDWVEILDHQCRPHAAPTGEACFPGKGNGYPGQG